VSFFAKYGNVTPIKYINCVLTVTPPETFRPYDLTVLPFKEGEITLPEYYTISASGITHVIYTSRKKDKNAEMSTEV